jgi:hypothetical protein
MKFGLREALSLSFSRDHARKATSRILQPEGEKLGGKRPVKYAALPSDNQNGKIPAPLLRSRGSS